MSASPTGFIIMRLPSFFADEKDAVKLLKYREILYSLESSVNKCKDVTQSLNVILVNR